MSEQIDTVERELVRTALAAAADTGLELCVTVSSSRLQRITGRPGSDPATDLGWERLIILDATIDGAAHTIVSSLPDSEEAGDLVARLVRRLSGGQSGRVTGPGPVSVPAVCFQSVADCELTGSYRLLLDELCGEAGVVPGMLSLGGRTGITAVGTGSHVTVYSFETYSAFAHCLAESEHGPGEGSHSVVASSLDALRSRALPARTAAKARLAARARPPHSALLSAEAVLTPEVSSHILYAAAEVLFGPSPPEPGAQVAAPGITIVDDGLLSSGINSRPVDDTGRRHRRRTLVDRGIVVPADPPAMRRASIWDQPGPAPTNLLIRPHDGVSDPACSLVIDHAIARGPVTSTGTMELVAVGTWNGESVGPLQFKVDPFCWLSRVAATGPTLEWHGEQGHIGAPALKISSLQA